MKLGNIQVREGSKGKTYRAQIRKKGYKHMSKSFKSKDRAEKWLKDNIFAIEQGLPYETKEMRTFTLSDIIDRYLKEEMDPSNSNYKTRKGQLEWWKAEIGNLVLSQVREDAICKCKDKLLKTPDKFGNLRKGSTINRYLTTLSVVLDIARKEWRLFKGEPIKNIRKCQESQPRDRFLNHEERARLLDACKKSPCKHLYPFVLICLCCGLRKGEILGLKWKNINFEEQLIQIPKTKNGSRIDIPLRDPVLSVLKDLKEVSDKNLDSLLFPGKNPSKPCDFRKAWKIAITEAGLSDITPHDMRRTFISNLGELGYPLHVAAKLANHKTLSITYSVYSQLSKPQIAEAVESLGKDIMKSS